MVRAQANANEKQGLAMVDAARTPVPFRQALASFRLNRWATFTTFVSAVPRSCPTGVRAYQTVGGDVAWVRRSITPWYSRLRRRLVSIFADTPSRSYCNSVKQRSPSRRYQITSAV